MRRRTIRPLAVIRGLRAAGFGDPPAAWGDFARYVDVRRGTVVVFLGPNGAGKTST
jgi:hypothetical protein